MRLGLVLAALLPVVASAGRAEATVSVPELIRGEHVPKMPSTSVAARSAASAGRRRLQRTADTCAGCTCIPAHYTDECAAHTAPTDCANDGRCSLNDKGTGPTCALTHATVDACAAIEDQAQCDLETGCTYDTAGSACGATTAAATCTAEASNGESACTSAGDCTYDDGTSDDVCEPACTYVANEDARITDRTDGSEWDTELAAKITGLPMAPSATCTDQMAENTGASAACTYDCASLIVEYFPSTTQTTRCFVYDTASGSWPTELTDMIQTSKPYDPSDSTVTVADNTIYVPVDESWIIQGTSSPSGLPPVLDARIASGSRDSISRAGLILRGFRITGQTGPLDSKGSWYTFSNANIGNDPTMRLGGAVSYEGHGTRLLFERMVIDHSVANSGGGIFVYGHFQQNPNLLRTQIDVLDCLFWGNQARWMGGDMRLLDIWPMDATIEGSNFYDSWAFLFHTVAMSQNANAMNADHAVGVHTGAVLTGTPGHDSSLIFRDCLMDGTDMDLDNALVPGWAGIGIDIIFASGGWERTADGPILQIVRENVVTQNYLCEYHNGFLFQNYLQGAAGMLFNGTISSSDWWDNKGRSAGNQNTQGGVTALLDWLLIENSRFRNGGFVADTQTGGEGGAVRFEAVEKVTIRHSSFDNNWAALGGAIAASGPATMEIHSCSFTGNKASRSGGAIEYKFLGGLDVISSVFTRNVVDTLVPPTQDITVRVYSGSAGNPGAQSGDRGMEEIVWFLVPTCDPCTADDLPSAVDGSIDHIPGITLYGNGAYEPYQTYSQQVSLAPGEYTLFHGSEINSQTYTSEWKAGGWIDAVGFVDRTYVAFDDNRNSERASGCYHGSDDAPATAATCPLGQKFWSQTDFRVGFGNGGAISVAGASSVAIRSCTFSENAAGYGTTLYGISVNSVDLVETTVDTIQPLLLFGATLETCNSRPCLEGQQCSTAQSSRMCSACRVNEIGDGRQCQTCPAGTEPNPDQTECIDCSAGSNSRLGQCEECGPGAFSPGTGAAVCSPCPESTRPTEDHVGCVCDAGSYNATGGIHVCFARGYDDEQYNDGISQTLASQAESGLECGSCPQDERGDECLQCTDGLTQIAPGFVSPVLPEGTGMDIGVEHVLVFRCHYKMDVAEKRCPGDTTTTGERRRLSSASCAHGYRGYVCGECAEDYGMNSQQECEPCGETGFTGKTLGIMAAMVGGVIFAFGVLSCFWRQFSLKHVVRCAFGPGRILITYSQITSQLGDVLDFTYPGLFGDVIAFLKPIMVRETPF
jgi:hypothetical protein